ncbi:MAG: HPr family phosphocarrier protein [Lachnobacterium sp.]|nr:HPr family phosphocarrier protein [Lachnobacterium sp.]
MKTFDYTIKDALGIHARPAGLLVKEVGKYQSKISLTKDGKTVDAARLMAVMSLGVKQGQTITVTAEGDDEEAAASEIQAFFEANL